MSTHAEFKDAMARFPSGVTINTTIDHTGRWCGFTASSFCSVSVAPPLVLVCLANTAECQPAFAAAGRWNIHVIDPDHAELAVRFATRGPTSSPTPVSIRISMAFPSCRRRA